MLIKESLTGLVLCGGQSSRMGTDKGLIITGGLTWGEIALYKLSSLGISTFTAINNSQRKDYAKVFSSHNLIIDNSDINVQGPLKGLFSFHNLFPDKDVMVLACDMVGMRTTILHTLQQLYSKEKQNYEVFIYKQEDYVESLVAIYSAPFLAKVYRLYKTGELERYSLQYLVSKGKALEIPVAEYEKLCFTNCNYPSDVNGYFQLS